jgi:hypothetical protein
MERQEQDGMIRRRRWIQPEFFTSEDVLALPRDARLTFIGLWLYADDYGRERTNAALIKADVWPVEEEITADVVEEHLLLLADRGMIRLYELAGREYFQLTGWDRWQPVQNPSRSNIPAPPAPSACTEPEQAPQTAYVDPSEDPRSEGEREEREGEREEGESQGEGVSERAAGITRPPSPFCDRHPGGTSKPCKACGTARLRLKHWENERDEAA